MSVLEEKLAQWRKQTDVPAPPPGLMEEILLARAPVRRHEPPPRQIPWRLMAGLIAASLAMFAGYSGLRSEPSHRPAPVDPADLTRDPIEYSFGYGEGVDVERIDQKVFDLDFKSPVKSVVLVHFQARDISAGEVMVSVNGTDVGYVPPDTLAVNERSNELLVPPSALLRNGKNKVIFDNVHNPPGRETWRIWNVWVEIFPLPELGREELIKTAQETLRRGQDFWDRREIGAENLYKAWRSFREAWLILEALEGPKPMEYTVARDKMREAQVSLDRLCSKLLLEAQGEYNGKLYEQSRSTLEHVNEYFPKRDQPCPMRAERLREQYGL